MTSFSRHSLSSASRGPRATAPRGHADYCDPPLGNLLDYHGLNRFEALWHVAAQDVDAPNRERGGISTVSLLTLEDEQGQTHRLYLKRQTNHLGRSLSRPLGEPTFSREWRAIRHYHALGIPSVDAGWYGERRTGKEWRAILITFDLDGRDDLDHWHARWPALDDTRRTQVITASARLVRQIHQAGMMHGCLFPKHLFLSRPQPAADGTSAMQEQMDAVIIDLEKTRRFVLRRHECQRDLYVLWRRLKAWQAAEWREFLAVYLDCPAQSDEVSRWLNELEARAQRKRR
ncbi:MULTISPECIES: lipopolysaccharide kinase InaA family protein [Cobetia]|uniref:lipopolysaccharide kinase InaA family protein n=1 Tax=Cobetia TaxID=204286 RepID=UPI001483A9DC|nr:MULTISPECIES: lipopolysaccharide kinase InaA family protein [Cobetia]